MTLGAKCLPGFRMNPLEPVPCICRQRMPSLDARCHALVALLVATHVAPCTSLDRPLFVGAHVPAHVRAGSASDAATSALLRRAQPATPRGVACRNAPGRCRSAAAARAAGPGAMGREDELDLLKSAFDRMDERGVRCQQLDVHQRAQLLRFARAVAEQGGGGGATDDLSSSSAAWALAGRWRLVLAPQEWTWLLAFSPGADVLVPAPPCGQH